MGRWGHRMFEGDQDMDIEGQIISEIQKKVKARGVYMEDEHMFDLFYNLEEPDYRPTRFSITSRELRGHIKSMSGQLLKQYRTNPDASYGQYATIVLSAVMMKTGCKISEENRTFLRQAAHGTSSRSSRSWFALFSGDIGFRDPGKAQFLSALDNYKNGKPRDFRAPSCFHCGKTNVDIAPASLSKCQSCEHAWYCNQDCQKTNWDNHKAICGPPPTIFGVVIMNV